MSNFAFTNYNYNKNAVKYEHKDLSSRVSSRNCLLQENVWKEPTWPELGDCLIKQCFITSMITATITPKIMMVLTKHSCKPDNILSH